MYGERSNDEDNEVDETFQANLLRYVDSLLSSNSPIELRLAHVAERYNAVLHCEESVIVAGTYVLAWLHLGAALTHYDLPGLHLLAVVALDAEIFWL